MIKKITISIVTKKLPSGHLATDQTIEVDAVSSDGNVNALDAVKVLGDAIVTIIEKAKPNKKDVHVTITEPVKPNKKDAQG